MRLIHVINKVQRQRGGQLTVTETEAAVEKEATEAAAMVEV